MDSTSLSSFRKWLPIEVTRNDASEAINTALCSAIYLIYKSKYIQMRFSACATLLHYICIHLLESQCSSWYTNSFLPKNLFISDKKQTHHAPTDSFLCVLNKFLGFFRCLRSLGHLRALRSSGRSLVSCRSTNPYVAAHTVSLYYGVL